MANTNIFISYRRAHTAGHTGRLYDRLRQHFGDKAAVFMDLDTLSPGEDVSTSIETAVGSCNALIVMVGDQWVSVKGTDGNPRLHNFDDYVRNEVAVALKRNILVIPVLVEGAPMPQAKELPPDLVKLVRLNALEISDGRWEHDTHRLIGRLEQELGVRQLAVASQAKPPLPIWKKPLVISAALALLLCLALWGRGLVRLTRPSSSLQPSPTPSDMAKTAPKD
ncbi:MAG: toll/interleukin-1 receptor domain-containing protein [Acidobacteriota bacterium]